MIKYKIIIMRRNIFKVLWNIFKWIYYCMMYTTGVYTFFVAIMFFNQLRPFTMDALETPIFNIVCMITLTISSYYAGLGAKKISKGY